MSRKIHIISTAFLTDAQQRQLSEHNIEAEIIPFIRTVPVVNAEDATRIKQMRSQPLTAVFTSVHGVEAIRDILIQKPTDWKLYCISGSTKEEAERYFGETAIVGTAIDATDLVKKIIADNPGRLVFFCGNLRLDIIPNELAAAKMNFEEMVVYHTELTPRKIQRVPDGVLFFSSSAVNSFFSMNELNNRTVCFSIGATTESAIKRKTANDVIVASQPGRKEMIDLVIQYYNEHR